MQWEPVKILDYDLALLKRCQNRPKVRPKCAEEGFGGNVGPGRGWACIASQSNYWTVTLHY